MVVRKIDLALLYLYITYIFSEQVDNVHLHVNVYINSSNGPALIQSKNNKTQQNIQYDINFAKSS